MEGDRHSLAIEVLGKALNDKVMEFYQNVKGIKPTVWVIVREVPADNWIIAGESVAELRKRMQEKK